MFCAHGCPFPTRTVSSMLHTACVLFLCKSMRLVLHCIRRTSVAFSVHPCRTAPPPKKKKSQRNVHTMAHRMAQPLINLLSNKNATHNSPSVNPALVYSTACAAVVETFSVESHSVDAMLSVLSSDQRPHSTFDYHFFPSHLKNRQKVYTRTAKTTATADLH